MPAALFWILYTVAAVWLQSLFPGPDLFAPALLLLLQEQKLSRLSWLLPLWILIQEGSGSLYFGTSLLWYSGLILLFYYTENLLDTRGFLFIFLISTFAGLWQYLCLYLLSSLQELEVSRQLLLEQSLQTVLALPLLWLILLGLKNRLLKGAHV
ncbi:MAG: hypothetical protein ACLFRL_00145 [Desulfohalobiaceae bacterium]